MTAKRNETTAAGSHCRTKRVHLHSLSGPFTAQTELPSQTKLAAQELRHKTEHYPFFPAPICPFYSVKQKHFRDPREQTFQELALRKFSKWRDC